MRSEHDPGSEHASVRRPRHRSERKTAKRIDVLLSGRNDEPRDRTVIVELEQWETAQATARDGIVRTVIGGRLRDTTYPSYQSKKDPRLQEADP